MATCASFRRSRRTRPIGYSVRPTINVAIGSRGTYLSIAGSASLPRELVVAENTSTNDPIRQCSRRRADTMDGSPYGVVERTDWGIRPWGCHVTINRYLGALRHRWRILVATTVVALVIGVTISYAATPQYVASSTSFVGTPASSSESGQLYSNSQYTLNQVASYPELAQSPDVLQPTIDDVGLQMTQQELKQMITVTNPSGTALLVVTVQSSNPRTAAAIANAVATHLGNEIETLETPHGSTQSPVKVTQAVPATIPAAPVSPRKTLNLALALIAGLCLGGVLALLRDHLDTTVKTSSDLEDSGVSGTLGRVRFDADVGRAPLAMIYGPQPVVEDFRTIRTNLRFADPDSSGRQYLVTSAVAGEGKSVTACNIAIALAQADLRVCLVEGDLRRPSASRYLGIDSVPGLTDVVAGDYELHEALVSWRHGLLTVLPSGTTPPDPVRLLSSDATAQVLAELRSQYDVVVVDAPPVLPVSDAQVIGGHSDGVILVTRHHKTKREQVRHSVSSLSGAGANVIGAVLTQVPKRDFGRTYGHSYGGQQVTPQHEADEREMATASAMPAARR